MKAQNTLVNQNKKRKHSFLSAQLEDIDKYRPKYIPIN